MEKDLKDKYIELLEKDRERQIEDIRKEYREILRKKDDEYNRISNLFCELTEIKDIEKEIEKVKQIIDRYRYKRF